MLVLVVHLTRGAVSSAPGIKEKKEEKEEEKSQAWIWCVRCSWIWSKCSSIFFQGFGLFNIPLHTYPYRAKFDIFSPTDIVHLPLRVRAYGSAWLLPKLWRRMQHGGGTSPPAWWWLQQSWLHWQLWLWFVITFVGPACICRPSKFPGTTHKQRCSGTFKQPPR